MAHVASTSSGARAGSSSTRLNSDATRPSRHLARWGELSEEGFGGGLQVDRRGRRRRSGRCRSWCGGGIVRPAQADGHDRLARRRERRGQLPLAASRARSNVPRTMTSALCAAPMRPSRTSAPTAAGANWRTARADAARRVVLRRRCASAHRARPPAPAARRSAATGRPLSRCRVTALRATSSASARCSGLLSTAGSGTLAARPSTPAECRAWPSPPES